MNKAKLTVVVDFKGTKFFTNVNGGTFTQHETLEQAQEWLQYEGHYDFETVTDVRFSY